MGADILWILGAWRIYIGVTTGTHGECVIYKCDSVEIETGGSSSLLIGVGVFVIEVALVVEMIERLDAALFHDF